MTHAAPFSLDRRTFLQFAAAGFVGAAVVGSPLRVFAQDGGLKGMKIATIGAGNEGGALGTVFAKLGHPVMFSSRHPDQLKDLVAGAGPTAKAGTVAEAVAFGEIILLVVPYTAIEAIGKEFGQQLAAKPLIIDVSNPIPRRDGEDFVKQVASEGGPGIVTQKLLPGAKIVRGFNAIGHNALATDGHRAGDPVGVPIAGDDKGAIALATTLIKETGFEPVLIGGLAKGKYLVPGTPLGGEHTPAEIQKIVATLA
ncbi:MAG: NADPH-dependent F420 reductase [Alphaproteobacteria bacterium]|nr:NADPH-dependent F420 reductase [Alphaproteobacteria bacterium]